MPSMAKLLKILKKEEKNIISDFEKSTTTCLDMIINNAIEETI